MFRGQISGAGNNSGSSSFSAGGISEYSVTPPQVANFGNRLVSDMFTIEYFDDFEHCLFAPPDAITDKMSGRIFETQLQSLSASRCIPWKYYECIRKLEEQEGGYI